MHWLARMAFVGIDVEQIPVAIDHQAQQLGWIEARASAATATATATASTDAPYTWTPHTASTET